MEIRIHFMGGAEAPVDAFRPAVDELFDLLNEAFDIDDGMPFEHSWKAVSEIAGQTFSGAPFELKFEAKFGGGFPRERQGDIVGPFVRVAEKGVEKMVASIFGEKGFKGFG